MLLWKLAKADIAEVEKEEGSSNAGKTVKAQGRAHLPNRFHQRFFGLARPKSACRPFAQIKKFCFPRIVCAQKREVLFWTTQRTLASTFALGCRSKAGIRKGSSCPLKQSRSSKPARSRTHLEVISRTSSFLQTNTFASSCTPTRAKKRLYLNRGVFIRLPKEGAFRRNSGRINRKHLGGSVSRVRWFANLWYSRLKGNCRTLDGSWTAVSFSQMNRR